MRASGDGFTNYTIDPAHSIVEFGVKYMRVSTVKGRFLGLQGRIHIDESTPANSSVEVMFRSDGVDTGVAERDAHLRSEDFLHSHLFPQIHFQSSAVERVAEGVWHVYGILTVRGISRPVVLEAILEGLMVDVEGTQRIGFAAATRLNRRDFGINWNGWMGRFLVADEVDVSINLEAFRQTR